MKRKPFCCPATQDLYKNYYISQSGHGMPVFAGSRGQRGHGLGSLLGGLFRSAFPMIKRGLAAFGKQALKTGLEIAKDVADGEDIKESAKKRVPDGIKTFAKRQGFISQRGEGRKRRKIGTKRKRRDIFG